MMLTDHFQTEVLQRLSVIETQTRRVLEDVDEIDGRVDKLETAHDKQYGFKAAIIMFGGLCVDAVAHFWGKR